jgi:hypothetical protein
MTVFEGAHSAKKMLDQGMQEIVPDYFEVVRQAKKNRLHILPRLHYSDMSLEQKNKIAERFSKSRTLVYGSYYVHTGTKGHFERFFIYTELVKVCIRNALLEFDELNIYLAKQGGWQKYQKSFLSDIRSVADENKRGGRYCRMNLELVSAVKAGVQVADFYAGAIRESLLSKDTTSFELLSAQIVLRQYCFLAAEAKSER